ncbi:MAG: sulfatase [Planctomycetota bacterium]
MSATGESRPNILLLIGEDTGRLLGCYGDPIARTPNLDRLADPANGGRRFDQAYTPAPVCAPSRSAIVTGRYPTALGTHHMRSTLLEPPRLFTHELRDAGYTVRWPTKLDFNFEPTAGWCDDTTPWLDDLAAGRVGSDGKPWLLYTNLVGTHESGMWPAASPDDPPNRPGGVREPAWLEPLASPPCPLTDPDVVRVPAYLPDTPAVRADLARHYDNLAMLDTRVGRILDALDASGQADDTLVIFLADHGRGMPREKRWCYPAGVHMPLIMRGPGITPGINPGIDTNLFSWVDLAPTLLNLAGVPIPDHYDGVPRLGPDAQSRRYAFGGRDRMDEAFDRVRFANDGRYHYLRNEAPDLPYAQRVRFMEFLPTTRELRRLHAAGQLAPPADAWMSNDKPVEELYDTTADPDCVTNLSDDPAHAEPLTQLRTALNAWRDDTGDLGLQRERDLVAQGLIADSITEYRARVAPLPPDQRLGLAQTVTEESDPR